jgi:hypothetical protein
MNDTMSRCQQVEEQYSKQRVIGCVRVFYLIESSELIEEVSGVMNERDVVRSHYKIKDMFSWGIGFKIRLLPEE